MPSSTSCKFLNWICVPKETCILAMDSLDTEELGAMTPDACKWVLLGNAPATLCPLAQPTPEMAHLPACNHGVSAADRLLHKAATRA